MSKTLPPVSEPEFRAIPLVSYCTKLQRKLDAYAADIHNYHPDGEGVGDNPACPCHMCVRIPPDLTDYLIKASELTDTILSRMTRCDQKNLQEVLRNRPSQYCHGNQPYGEMSCVSECACCDHFYDEFLGTFMEGSPKQMSLIQDLLHGRPVSDVLRPEHVDKTDTAGILIQILYRGAPEFVEHVRHLIYDDQDMPCHCSGCSDGEENDLLLAIQRSM